jgi:hypothetical protein
MKKLVLLAALFALSACTKLTKENYDTLEMGMTPKEVSDVLGEPDNCSEALGTKSCIWGSEDGAHIKVSFIADNAATFSNNGLE